MQVENQYLSRSSSYSVWLWLFVSSLDFSYFIGAKTTSNFQTNSRPCMYSSDQLIIIIITPVEVVVVLSNHLIIAIRALALRLSVVVCCCHPLILLFYQKVLTYPLWIEIDDITNNFIAWNKSFFMLFWWFNWFIFTLLLLNWV